MFCPQCGAPIKDNQPFCSSCGSTLMPSSGASNEPVSNVAPEPAPVPVTAPEPEFNPAFEPAPAPTYEAVSTAAPPKKKKKAVITIVSVVAVLAVLALGLFLFKDLIFPGNQGNACVYLADGKYELLTNLKGGQSITITSAKSQDLDSLSSTENRYLVVFSPDGKYVYYYTKYDNSENTGTLCRAEYGKLTSSGSQNDQHIDVIASNVRLGVQVLKNGTLAYVNGDGTMFYYDGKSANKVAREVNGFLTDRNTKILYESDGNLYGVETNDLNDRIKLASDISDVVTYTDFENILYVKGSYSDHDRALYSVGFHKEPTKIGDVDDILSGSAENNEFFYTLESGSVSLYDYVTDVDSGSNNTKKEPQLSDFATQGYSYRMITGTNLKESNYTELYTSCDRPLYWFGESLSSSSTMKSSLYRDWDDDTEAVHAATLAFINRFESSANADGYIKVTNDVKKALQDINQYGAHDWEWLWLCYTREPTTSAYDYDAYYDALDEYRNTKNQNELIEELKDQENDVTTYNLYRYQNGTTTLVAENVINTRNGSGGLVIYNTVDMITDKVSLKDVSGTSTVKELFKLKDGAENWLVTRDMKEPVQISASAADTVADAAKKSSVGFMVADSSIYMYKTDGGLYVATVDQSSVSDFDEISDDARVAYNSAGFDRLPTDRIVDDSLYYFSNTYEHDDTTYGDLYRYENGKAICLAKDVVTSGVRRYEDGTVLACTGVRNNEYELTRFDAKGDATYLADGVTMFKRASSGDVLILAEGDLYAFSGKETRLIENDVTGMWLMNESEPTAILGIS